MINFNRKTIAIIIIAALIGFGVWQGFLKKEEPSFALTEVVRGNISQEVSETGKVKQGEEINLNFKSSGKIEKIYVKVGDNIITGQDLAKLDTSQLFIQLTEAKAGLAVIEAGKKDAQISLESARQKLEDTIATTNEKIEKNYKDALSTLDDSYLKIYNSFIFIDLLKGTYFERGDIESINIAENKETIERALNQAKFYIDKAKDSQNKEDIDTALLEAKEALLKIKKALENIRNIIEAGGYSGIVPVADKNTLDTHKLNINSAYSNIVTSQTDISLTKTTNATEINTAQSQVSVLENQLQEGQDSLYQAQINQARAQAQLLENQIKDSLLKSPTQGQITKINKKVGEQSMLGDSIVSLLPVVPFTIEADIYEEDVVKINIGNPVDISLVAFPEQSFKGKVISIEPAEKIIEGVVYYQITIAFEKLPEGVKPGMTADLVIKTASKENVLIIPEDAIQKKDSKQIAEVFKDGISEDREIETGFFGTNYMVEVISGLEEGEKVILY
ncbi:MAG: efflux RND transporter periplasmic adaptor subunit [Candidatus Pacebacteria bacterium]|nr:efflux RND transporter periplasmic adaptor subunit [Candidatus Paceibacterota bacterium]